jgi:hypothetical protein
LGYRNVSRSYPRALPGRRDSVKLALTMSQSDFDPNYVFAHHSSTPEKLVHYDALHEAARVFAQVILKHTPPSDDQSAALRLLREATMIACAAVALDGRLK